MRSGYSALEMLAADQQALLGLTGEAEPWKAAALIEQLSPTMIVHVKARKHLPMGHP